MNTISIETKSDKNEPRSVQKANSYRYQMNWNRIRNVVLSLLLIMSFGGVAHGAGIILEPPGLLRGDQYRLVFVTSTTRNAFSPNINDYNAFVQAVADASPLAALGTTWLAIGSTSAVDARDNTGTQLLGPNSYPIFRLDGLRVAPDNAGLWDGSIDRPININEAGVALLGPVPVWSGTTTGGVESANPLGSPFSVSTGMGGSIFFSWISDSTADPFETRRFYAMSAPITVPVPEPSSCALMGMAIAAWALGRRRSKKSSGSPPAAPNA